MSRKNSFAKVIGFVLSFVIAGALLGWGASAVFGGKTGTFTITFCETTDTHGAFFDSLYVDGLANKTSFSNVSSYLRKIRGDGECPIVVDAGDNLQGDNAAYYFNFVNVVDSHLVSRIFNYLDYDAVIVGNHDIESGHGVYDRVAKEIGIPYLASNALHSEGLKSGKPYFEEYTVVKRNGVKVAVIGMTNANIKSWLAEEKWKGMDFRVISDMAQETVDRIVKKTRPNLVVLVMHTGCGTGERDIENEARYIASNLKGIDVVLYGHDHTAVSEIVDNPNGEVAFMNAGTKNANVARCDVTLEMKYGRVLSRKFETRLVPMDEYEPDPDFNTYFKSYYDEVKAFANKEIGDLNADLDFTCALDGPSAFISLIHAVQLEATGADISITAPLSLKGGVSKGKVTFRDLANIYRFENTLNKVEMTGRQIKDYLEYSYDNWIRREGPTYNYDSAEGIDYNVSLSAEKGNRITILQLSSGRPFKMDEVYTVAMNSYRSSGGGKLLLNGAGIEPKDLKIIDKYKDIRSLVGDYISKHVEVDPKASSNWKFVK